MPEFHITLPDGTPNIPVFMQVVDALAKSFSDEARVIHIQPVEDVLPQVTALYPEEAEFVRKVQLFADTILSAPANVSWKWFLHRILLGGNSAECVERDLSDGFRPEAVAFSRYMRKRLPDVIKPHEKPAELLAHHDRKYYPDGGYMGVEYVPTLLGRAVYRKLKEAGYFGSAAGNEAGNDG